MGPSRRAIRHSCDDGDACMASRGAIRHSVSSGHEPRVRLPSQTVRPAKEGDDSFGKKETIHSKGRRGFEDASSSIVSSRSRTGSVCDIISTSRRYHDFSLTGRADDALLELEVDRVVIPASSPPRTTTTRPRRDRQTPPPASPQTNTHGWARTRC